MPPLPSTSSTVVARDKEPLLIFISLFAHHHDLRLVGDGVSLFHSMAHC